MFHVAGTGLSVCLPVMRERAISRKHYNLLNNFGAVHNKGVAVRYDEEIRHPFGLCAPNRNHAVIGVWNDPRKQGDKAAVPSSHSTGATARECSHRRCPTDAVTMKENNDLVINGERTVRAGLVDVRVRGKADDRDE